ncbi:ZIP family metal transporter [Candidatus Woesearchaeota archaeon]|nr:ZIP family metal transporter [Candidatus Woesearchaeota archaeon]
MLQNFYYALIAVVIISLISFIGAITLFFKKKLMQKLVLILVSFAAGALLGGAFLHLLPEAMHEGGPIFLMTVIGIIVFFVMEVYLYWYHCHAGHIHKHKHREHKCPVRPMGYLNLFGDGVHNIIDGMIVATAFMVNMELGIVTAFAVVLHEIPQEIGDFGVLVYSGFSRHNALLFNFISALAAILGVVLTYFFASYVQDFTLYLIPFAAGGFIYIATTDLMAEIKEESNIKTATLQLFIFLLGIAVMWLAKSALLH